jgi:hypothetical protein
MHDLSDPPRPLTDEIDAHADLVAASIDQTATFGDLVAAAAAEYETLLRSVARLGPAYAFDRPGRPAAVDAVRQALPAIERELFDAILDDFACERAAIEEGLFRVALAHGRRQRPAGG